MIPYLYLTDLAVSCMSFWLRVGSLSAGPFLRPVLGRSWFSADSGTEALSLRKTA